MIVPATQVRFAVTTAGSREEAERIATALVEEHLAACVNILAGVKSVYRWQGEVETAEEVLLLIKTSAENLDAAEAAVRRLHSYEVPEFLVLHPDGGSKAYLDWLLHAVNGR